MSSVFPVQKIKRLRDRSASKASSLGREKVSGTLIVSFNWLIVIFLSLNCRMYKRYLYFEINDAPKLLNINCILDFVHAGLQPGHHKTSHSL